jgi:hypothetical protein
MQLSLCLRGDEVFFCGHQKKKEGLLEDCWRRKSDYLFQYDSFIGIRGDIGELLEMLLGGCMII